MTLWLKKSTAVVISFGPFVSPTDGVTLQTGLVTAIDHATTGIFLSKNGGALTIRHQAVTASTYDAYGNYLVTLDTTDTGTLGTLRVQFAAAASCLPVWLDCEVLPANMWNSLFGTGGSVPDAVAGASGGLPLSVDASGRVDVLKINGTSQTARDIGASVLLSSGSGAGQLDFTSGVVKSSLSQILGTALTETSGQIAAAFKHLFDVAAPVLTAASINQTGDAYARIGAAGAGLTALGDTRIANLDAAVSTRLATTGYTAPDNADIALIKAKTDNLPAAPAAVSDVPTANVNADALLDRAAGVETGMTPRQALRGISAMLFGKASGGQTGTEIFRNAVADSKARLTFTDDAQGNRTAVVSDLT